MKDEINTCTQRAVSRKRGGSADLKGSAGMCRLDSENKVESYVKLDKLEKMLKKIEY